MSRIDETRVWQREQLVVERVVQHAAEVARRPTEGNSQIGPANVADKQRVTGENRGRYAGVRFEIEYQQ